MGINKIRKSIVLDIATPVSMENVVYMSQYDNKTHEVEIAITDNGMPYTIAGDGSIVARVFCDKPDGHDIFNTATISGGKVVVTFTDQMLAAAGPMPVRVALFGQAGERLTTVDFVIMVRENRAENGILSSSEFEALTAALSSIDGAYDKANSAWETIHEVQAVIEQSITDAQEATVTANNAAKRVDEAIGSVEETIKTTAKLNTEVSVARDSETDLDTRLDKIESGERMKGAGKFPIATKEQARGGIDNNVLMTPLRTAEAIEALGGGGGGGGGGSTIPIMTSTFESGSFSVNQEIEVRYRWSSPNIGYGYLHVFLNNVEIHTEEVQQGLNRLVVPGQIKGNYTLLIYVTDRGGLTTDKLSYTLKIGGLDITSTFDDSQDFTIKSVIRIPVTIDTISLDPIYMIQTIDGKITRLAGQNGYNIVQLPAMTPGAHKVVISAESGVYKSNLLSFDIVIEDADTLTIICDFSTDQVSFRDLVEIPYRVSLKGVSKFNASYLVDGKSVKSLEIKAGSNIWSTRDLAIGYHVLRINVSTIDGTKTAFVEKRLTVNPSAYTPLQPVQDASLVAWFDATGRTNQDVNKTEWLDKSGNGVVANLVDFNFGSGNGWMDNTLKCSGGSYVEIDLQALKDNAPYGMTVDVKFKTRDTGEELACVLDMRGSDTNSKGFAIDAKNMYLNSGATKVKSAVVEDEISRATFVIDRENRMASIYNNAVLTEAFLTQPDESFSNTTKIYINTTLALVSGKWVPSLFGNCEIYSIRIYERALSGDEIVQNHIADIPELDVQEEKYRLNFENTMPTMYFYGDTSAMTKDTKVPLHIRYISTDAGKYGESFDLVNCPVSWQGTSSLQYAVKNYKIKLTNQDGSKYKYTPYPNGIPESTFCLKADYMESSHANNTGMAKFINDKLYSEKVPPQQTNPKVRTTIDGFPIQLYIAQSDGDTPVYMGVFNFNLDKGCNDSFGFDDNTLSFEVSSNSDTSAGAFKDDSDASMRTDFELRYPDEGDCTAEQVDAFYAKMKRVVTWVKNSTEATFAAEVTQYFNKEFLLKYYLQVHLFGMVDNLGKNMMLTTWDGNIWYPQFYDMDTQLGLDNTGYLKFLSDIDVVAGIYNTSGSKLWTMVAKVFASELSEMYKTMRQTVYKLDTVLSYWYGTQVSKIGEKQYNADMEAKYIQFKNDYLFMLHGRRYEHLKRWLTERLLYLDTIYGYEENTRQSITVRANKSGSVSIQILTYSPQYLRVVWRNGVEQKLKIGRNAAGDMVATTFSATLATSTDQEVIIYSARNIKYITGLANLSPSVLNLVEASKLTKMDCQNATLLTDIRLSANNGFLRYLNLNGCLKLGTAAGGGNTLDFSSVYNMRQLFLENTALQNVVLPKDGSNFQEIRFPTTLKSLDLQNMPALKSIGTVAKGTLSLFKVFNCPNINPNEIAGTDFSIRADSVSIENSFITGNPTDDLYIGDEKMQPINIKIKNMSAFNSRKIVVRGKIDKSPSVPVAESFEAIGCHPKEIVFRTFGFVEPQTLDLSDFNGSSIVIENFANIKEVIMPKFFRGFAFFGAFISDSVTTFPIELKACNICFYDHDNYNQIDLSGQTITDYFHWRTMPKDLDVIVNIDLSQRREGLYVNDLDQYRENIASIKFSEVNVFGKIKFGNYAMNPFEASKVTDAIFTNIIFDTSDSIHFTRAFYGCSKITKITNLDISKGKDFYNMFYGCGSLKSIDFTGTIPREFGEATSGLSNLSSLDGETMNSITKALSDYSDQAAATLRFNAAVFAKLTDEQKAIAAAKNWTLTA